MVDEPQGPPPPQASAIPQEALDRWAALPPDQFLALGMTKLDLDNLFLGLRGMVVAHSHLEAALAALDRQDPKALNDAFAASHKIMVNSFNQINAFIAAAMTTATPVGGGSNE